MSDMAYRSLGTSGLMVSEVCLGTWAIGGMGWGEVDDQDSIAAIRQALDVGMTFIDTAHIYGRGHSEEIVGQALEGRREEAVICTKVHTHWNEKGETWADCSYDGIMRAFEAALERLRTDYVDVYLMHNFDPNTPISESMRALEKLLHDGAVRAVGVSRYSLEQLQEAQRCLPLHAVQYPLNMIRRHEIAPILPFCREHDIGVMAYAPLAKGLLTGKFDASTTFPENDNRSQNPTFQGEAFRERLAAVEQLEPIAARHGKTLAQLAIAWNLSQPGVTTALTGAKRPEQVEENAGGAGWQVSQKDLEEIEQIVAGLTDLE
jgi:aryl-alcohol dehydrogenase-like predicted oxidoreductase